MTPQAPPHPSMRACPLPRWPSVHNALNQRGWRTHHLARQLGHPPSLVLAWLYGQEPMPHHLRRRTEQLLGLPPASLS